MSPQALDLVPELLFPTSKILIFFRLAAPSGHPVRAVRQLPHQLRAHVQDWPERTQFRAPEHGSGTVDMGLR